MGESENGKVSVPGSEPGCRVVSVHGECVWMEECAQRRQCAGELMWMEK